MVKIDRLGWAAGISVSCYGVRLGIRVRDASLLPELLARLPPGWKERESPFVDHVYSVLEGASSARIKRYNILYRDHVMKARSNDYGEVLAGLGKHAQLDVAALTTQRVFVHAGVVGWKGRAIVIPGRSYSGKTSMVAALIDAGATYYSDEYAVFDAAGRVHPYPVALNLRQGEDGPTRSVPAADLGATLGSRPLPVGLVLVSRYKEGRSWRPREMTPGRGLLALLRHTVPVRHRPADSLATLGRVAARAQALSSERGEATETAAAVLDHLERSSRRPS
jgi:hypothetical protein